MSKKIRPITVNPEIEAFLLQFGTVAKSDDAELISEDSARCPRYKDRFLLQENAICRKARNLALKKSRDRKIWTDDVQPTGKDVRYWVGETFPGRDRYLIYKVTERKDPLRVRRALDSSAEKLAEI